MDPSEKHLRIALALLIFMAHVIVPSMVFADNEVLPGGNGPDGPGGPGPDPCRGGCCATGGDPVFIKNGEFKYSETDVSISGRKLPILLERTYQNQHDYNSSFGYGWDFNFNLKVRRLYDPNTIIFQNGQCLRREFTRDATDPDIFTRLGDPTNYFDYDDVNDTFTYVQDDGINRSFDINGNLSAITDENGNSITFTYDANGLMPVYSVSDFFLDEQFGGPSTGRGLVAMAYKLTKITDDLGRDIDLSYDENGLLETITDFADRTWDYSYDPATNDLLAVTGPATDDYPGGLSTTYNYDTSHNLTNIIDANNDTRTVNYYDSEDKVWKQTVGYGDYLFSYDDANSTGTITDREGFDTKKVYDGDGLLTSETIYTSNPQSDPNSFTTTHAYDSSFQRTRTIFPKGNCIYYTYDSLGNTTGIYKKTSPDDPNTASDPNVIATIFTYDPNFTSKIKTETDPTGNVITYDYNDITGNLESTTYPTVSTPEGNKTPILRLSYNTYGQVTEVNSPDGTITKYEYYSDANDANNYGRRWKTIVDYGVGGSYLNITTAYKYNAVGNVIEVNDPNSDITQLVYNNLNQLTKVTSAFNYITTLSYDKNGNLSEKRKDIAGPNQVTSSVYDVLKKRTSLTDPLGNVTAFGYNKNEDPNLITDAENNSTTEQYNERGLLWKVTDANGDITSYSYDAFDRLTTITYPGNTTEVFGYDKNSNVTSKKNRKNETIYFEYDVLNRMTVKNRPNDPNIVFQYDISGRIVDVNDDRSVSNGGGLTNFSYDSIGRAIEVNDIESRLISYEYNNKGLRTKLTYPDNDYITYEYDAMNRLAKIKDSDANSIAEYSYDELSRRTLATLGNDANAVYTYDLAERLTKLINNIDDTNTITFEYANYDNVDNRLSMKIDDANAHVYTYDNRYQLTFVDYNDGNSTSYTYDSLGNRTDVNDGNSTSYARNALNQYTSVGAASYSYDDNGNLTDDGTYKYYYDCENRLTDVNDANNNAVTSYKYDYKGRRVSKTVYGSPNITTKYCYDGSQVIAEYDGNDVLLRKFIYGPGIDEPIIMIDVTDNNSIYYYHFDGLGSVAALSNINGEIVERYSYDVFGTPTVTDAGGTVIADSNYSNPYMFTSRRLDPETDNYYYRARYYAPNIGRFLQPDPVAAYLQFASLKKNSAFDFPGIYLAPWTIENYLKTDPIGRFLRTDPAGRYLLKNQYGALVESNLYTYVRNNPVIFTDSYGLSVWTWVGEVFKVGGSGLLASAAMAGLAVAVTMPAWVIPVGVGALFFGVGLQIGDAIWNDSLDDPPGSKMIKRYRKELEKGCD